MSRICPTVNLMPSPDGNEDSAALPAKVVSNKTLLATEIDGQWQRLSVDAEVAAGQKLVVGPTFRATLVTPNSEFTLIGPAAAVLIGGTDGRLGSAFEFRTHVGFRGSNQGLRLRFSWLRLNWRLNLQVRIRWLQFKCTAHERQALTR